MSLNSYAASLARGTDPHIAAEFAITAETSVRPHGLGDGPVTFKHGADDVIGTEGNDDLTGGRGRDNVVGGGGDDTEHGGGGNDTMSGDAGDDTMHGDDGNDHMSGGDGLDDMFGDDGADHINGEAGDDHMSGGLGDDVESGGQGADDLAGDEGNDDLAGGKGDDHVNGEAGDDTMSGGRGDDVFMWDDNGIDGVDHVEDFAAGHDVLDLQEVDADVGTVDDQGFHFVDDFSHEAGEATLAYDEVHNETTAAFDVDGDGIEDLTIVLNGNVGVEDGWIL